MSNPIRRSTETGSAFLEVPGVQVESLISLENPKLVRFDKIGPMCTPYGIAIIASFRSFDVSNPIVIVLCRENRARLPELCWARPAVRARPPIIRHRGHAFG